MKRTIFCISLIALFLTISGQSTRDQIEDKYKWDLTDIFSSDEAWNDSKLKLAEEMKLVESFKGKLTTSSSNLLEALEYQSNIWKRPLR
jgi:oligoendopeptidase F